MTIRKIIYLPDSRLRKQSAKVEDFDKNLEKLIDDLFETMYEAKGVGLAAPQVGINIQLAVIDVTGEKKNQLVLINPEIINMSGETQYDEGCLSIPGSFDKVIRATTVTVRAQNKTGEFFEIEAGGLLGECLQHEIDHLHGKLFIDLLSPLKRAIVRKKLEKYKRQLPKKDE